MSAFDPTQPIPACVPGQAGMRNQNIYTARITRDSSSDRLATPAARPACNGAFRSSPRTTAQSSGAIGLRSPTSRGRTGVVQTVRAVTTLDVEVPRGRRWRERFSRVPAILAQINVSVAEISRRAAPPQGRAAGTIVFNPDPTNPDLENPDLENPDLENPDLENAEVHNPDLETATTRNPELENPDLENPELRTPSSKTRGSPTRQSQARLENPDLENPELENPDLENPDLENPDLANGAFSDTTWTITNKGNTAGAYTVRLGAQPAAPRGFRSQLIAHKIIGPPGLGCSLLKQSQTVLLANIPNPRFVIASELANPELENPDLENLTIAIAPGETARITLRVFDPDRTMRSRSARRENVTPVAVAQAVNTPEADAGHHAARRRPACSRPVPRFRAARRVATTRRR